MGVYCLSYCPIFWKINHNWRELLIEIVCVCVCVCVTQAWKNLCGCKREKNGKMSKQKAYVKKIDPVCSIWGQLRECKSWISRFLRTQSVQNRGHRLAQSLYKHTKKRPQKEEVESAKITFSLSPSLSHAGVALGKWRKRALSPHLHCLTTILPID